jgi:hypothetical protein
MINDRSFDTHDRLQAEEGPFFGTGDIDATALCPACAVPSPSAP